MRKPLLLCALCLPAAAAHADTLGLYAGAALTTGSVNNVVNSGTNISNTDWKIFGGVHPPGSPFGLELEYLDFGSETHNFNYADGSTWALDAVGYLPLAPVFSLYGKAGLSRWELTDHVVGAPFDRLDDNGVQVTLGVGGLLRFGNFAARLEYERFNIDNTAGANVVTVGVQLTVL